MEIVSEKSLLLVAIVRLLAFGGCTLLFAFLFARRLRQSLRQLHLKFAMHNQQLVDLQRAYGQSVRGLPRLCPT